MSDMIKSLYDNTNAINPINFSGRITETHL